MAKKTKSAAAPKADAKAAKKAKKAKKELTPEQIAKKKARLEAIKNRPAGQRTNSKQVDIIEVEGAKGKVLNFAAPVRKRGCLVTSVVVDAEGNIISSSVAMVDNVRVKTKKGHGYFQFGAPGKGKDEIEEEETEEAPVAEEAEEDED